MEAPSSDALMPERRRCPLKPWGPFGGNGRGPRRKYFRWGNLGGTRRRGLDLTPMSEDGSLFPSPSTTKPLSECCLFSHNSENAMAAGCSPNKTHRKTNRPFDQAAVLSHSAAVGESVLLSKPAGFVRSAERDGIAKAAHLICEQCRAGGAGVPAGKIFDFSRGINKRQPQGEESRRYAMENPLFASGFFWRSRRDSNPRPSA